MINASKPPISGSIHAPPSPISHWGYSSRKEFALKELFFPLRVASTEKGYTCIEGQQIQYVYHVKCGPNHEGLYSYTYTLSINRKLTACHQWKRTSNKNSGITCRNAERYLSIHTQFILFREFQEQDIFTLLIKAALIEMLCFLRYTQQMIDRLIA